jgi:hypothetical protein
VTSALGGPFAVGTRTDPHAQIRQARQAPVLLHSLSLFREVFEKIYAHRKIATVVEIGVESGQVSGIYTELGADRVYCVDPLPSDELRRVLGENDALELVERPSPAVLPDLPVGDLYVIDGDHNYATVRGEVGWILQNAPDAVVVLHDVLWPCSRRDFYYQPSFVPEDQRHPATAEGPTVWQDGLTAAGLVGAGAYLCAVDAGGERNGVLTAVEDAMQEFGGDQWELEIIPAVLGVGVLVRRTDETLALLDEIRAYSRSPLLGALENNRISLYTRVLQLQYEASAHRVDADQMAQRLADQHQQIEELNGRLTALIESAGHQTPPPRAPRRRSTVEDRLARARRNVGGRVRRAAAALLGRDGVPLG